MTEFTEWRSLVDGERISAIPDIGDTQYYVDEGSGTTLSDSVGPTSATITNPNWQTESGAVGGAYLAVNGTDGYWETDSKFAIDSFTVAGWIRPQSYDFADMMSGGDGFNAGNESGFAIRTEDSDGNIRAGMAAADGDNSSELTGTNFVSSGNWGFVALIYDRTITNSLRLITYDAETELADVETNPTNDTASDASVTIRGGAAARNSTSPDSILTGDLDFAVIQGGAALSKSELEDVWSATNDR